MREILFRGKRIDSGEWVEGNYGNHTSLDAFIIYKPYTTMDGDFAALGFYEVVPESVGQYTGLTDKNGKKVFDGDICQIKNHRLIDDLPFVIEWEDSIYNGWVWRDFDEIGAKDSFTTSVASICEVIGNIHDPVNWR